MGPQSCLLVRCQAKVTTTRKQQEMDGVREKYNGVGFQIARTTLDDYRRRLDVAVKNEVRTKENMLSTLELLSTVRVGIDMLQSRLNGVVLPNGYDPEPITPQGDKTHDQTLRITAKVRSMLAAMEHRRKVLQSRGQTLDIATPATSRPDSPASHGGGDSDTSAGAGVATGPLFSSAAQDTPMHSSVGVRRSVTFAAGDSAPSSSAAGGRGGRGAHRDKDGHGHGHGHGATKASTSSHVGGGVAGTAHSGARSGHAGNDSGAKSSLVRSASHTVRSKRHKRGSNRGNGSSGGASNKDASSGASRVRDVHKAC